MATQFEYIGLAKIETGERAALVVARSQEGNVAAARLVVVLDADLLAEAAAEFSEAHGSVYNRSINPLHSAHVDLVAAEGGDVAGCKIAPEQGEHTVLPVRVITPARFTPPVVHRGVVVPHPALHRLTH